MRFARALMRAKRFTLQIQTTEVAASLCLMMGGGWTRANTTNGSLLAA